MGVKQNVDIKEYKCQTPVIFIFFNRPETMVQVLEQIQKVKPEKLYLVADGPRNEEEREKTDLCRKIAEEAVTWECQIEKVYAEENMGCCDRVASGISYVLKKEERVIILEDDIVPTLSFFRFQDELLEKYKDNDEIFYIGGFNAVPYVCGKEADYFCVRHFACWGWGTWAKKWNQVDLSMEYWADNKRAYRAVLEEYFGKSAYKWQKPILKEVYESTIDTWDYRVILWMACQSKTGILPRINMCRNVGFGSGTHTAHTSKFEKYDVEAEELDFPLVHPKSLKMDIKWQNERNRVEFLDGFYVKRFERSVKKAIKKMSRFLLKKDIKIKVAYVLGKECFLPTFCEVRENRKKEHVFSI